MKPLVNKSAALAILVLYICSPNFTDGRKKKNKDFVNRANLKVMLRKVPVLACCGIVTEIAIHVFNRPLDQILPVAEKLNVTSAKSYSQHSGAPNHSCLSAKQYKLLTSVSIYIKFVSFPL